MSSSIRFRRIRIVPERREVNLPVEPQEPVEILMEAVARRDRAAYSALYDRMAPRLFGLIRRVVRDQAISEEVLQEVMLEIWQRADSVDIGRSPVGWMLTLAHRRSVDRVRSEQAGRRRLEVVASSQHEPEFDHAAASAERAEERRQVLGALAALSDNQRQAIELAYYGGRTHREVAELLDMPLGTVKTRIRDGLAKLRATLGDAP